MLSKVKAEVDKIYYDVSNMPEEWRKRPKQTYEVQLTEEVGESVPAWSKRSKLLRSRGASSALRKRENSRVDLEGFTMKLRL